MIVKVLSCTMDIPISALSLLLEFSNYQSKAPLVQNEHSGKRLKLPNWLQLRSVLLHKGLHEGRGCCCSVMGSRCVKHSMGYMAAGAARGVQEDSEPAHSGSGLAHRGGSGNSHSEW